LNRRWPGRAGACFVILTHVFGVHMLFFEPLSVVAVCLLASQNSEKAGRRAEQEMEPHESNGRDRVESERRWRGDCVVPDYGPFSERASKREAIAARQWH
jgi:hypothetical protein